MNAPPTTISSKDVTRAQEEIRGPELGSATRRDRILQRVLAASRRLPRNSSDTAMRLR